MKSLSNGIQVRDRAVPRELPSQLFLHARGNAPSQAGQRVELLRSTPDARLKETSSADALDGAHEAGQR